MASAFLWSYPTTLLCVPAILRVRTEGPTESGCCAGETLIGATGYCLVTTDRCSCFLERKIVCLSRTFYETVHLIHLSEGDFTTVHEIAIYSFHAEYLPLIQHSVSRASPALGIACMSHGPFLEMCIAFSSCNNSRGLHVVVCTLLTHIALLAVLPVVCTGFKKCTPGVCGKCRPQCDGVLPPAKAPTGVYPKSTAQLGLFKINAD